MNLVDHKDMVVGQPYLLYFHGHVEIAVGTLESNDARHYIDFHADFRIIRGGRISDGKFEIHWGRTEEYNIPDEIFELTKHEYLCSIIETI
jgi:hypothetical protein